MKSAALTAVPKGVVTLRWPEVAFVGTPVVTVVEVAAVTVASVALNRRRSFNSVVSKWVPVTVTAVPATPMVGVKLEIVGAPAVVTVNGCGLVADPLGVVTLNVPVLAPAGTVVTSCVDVLAVTTAVV